MVLTDNQTDALKELISIAFARTADALSRLTGNHVSLDLPIVLVCPLEELTQHLPAILHGEIASVHQLFSGPLSGDAMLLLSCQDATLLNDLLTEQRVPSGRLDQSAREVLTEVGNILLNACLGMCGNLLRVRITFSVPRLRLDSLEDLLCSLVIGGEGVRYALVTYTRFHIQKRSVSGYVTIVLGVSALECLLDEVGCWVKRLTEEVPALPDRQESAKGDVSS